MGLDQWPYQAVGEHAIACMWLTSGLRVCGKKSIKHRSENPDLSLGAFPTYLCLFTSLVKYGKIHSLISLGFLYPKPGVTNYCFLPCGEVRITSI